MRLVRRTQTGFENPGFDSAQGCPIMALRSFSKRNVRQELRR